MKALALGLSLVANVALLVVLALKPMLAPPALRDFISGAFPFVAETTAVPAAPKATATRPAVADTTAPWADIATTTDLPALIARLRAAGFPANIVRAVITAELDARYLPRLRALQGPDPSIPYWRQTNGLLAGNSARQDEASALQRERTRVMRDLFKDSFFTGGIADPRPGIFAGLSPEKALLLQRIDDDYAEMIASVRTNSNGIMLPEDREKLALLNREKRADLAAVLSPAELEEYEIRTSNITSMLRSRLGAFEPTEAEFRAMFKAQQTLAEKYPNGSGGLLNQPNGRSTAQNEYNDQLRSILGEARLAEFGREADPEFQRFSRSATAAEIPRATVNEAYALRQVVERDSNHIFDDPALTADQKRIALKQLADNTRTQIGTLLGPVAGPAYLATINGWLSNVERGAAATFPKGAPLMISTGTGYTIYSNSPTYRTLPEARPNP